MQFHRSLVEGNYHFLWHDYGFISATQYMISFHCWMYCWLMFRTSRTVFAKLVPKYSVSNKPNGMVSRGLHSGLCACICWTLWDSCQPISLIYRDTFKWQLCPPASKLLIEIWKSFMNSIEVNSVLFLCTDYRRYLMLRINCHLLDFSVDYYLISLAVQPSLHPASNGSIQWIHPVCIATI